MSGEFKQVIKDGGKVDKLSCSVNLKAFYKDLHNYLVDKGYKDIIDDPEGGYLDYQAKKGEFVDNKANLNRTGDMFEKKLYIMKKDGITEIEIMWKAKRKSEQSSYGRYEFKLDLVCRNMKDVEIVEGNSKKVVQKGGWEFRNEFVYINTFEKDYLDKIPFLSKFPKIKEYLFEMMQGKLVEKDIDDGFTKFYPGIFSIIQKHFK
jgi:hypothetical protein